MTIPPLPSLPPVPPHAPRLTLGQRLRNYFLTGIVVVGPVVITIYIALWVIGIADGWVKPLVPKSVLPENYLPFAIPGFGILVLLVALTLLGFLAANLVGRSLVDFGETLLARMPVVSGLYRSVKQIFETIFSKSDTSFRKVGLVEYPAPGCWSVVLISSPPHRMWPLACRKAANSQPFSALRAEPDHRLLLLRPAREGRGNPDLGG